MLSKLKYRKLMLSGIGLAMAWFVVYHFTVSNTVELSKEIDQIAEQLKKYEEQKKDSAFVNFEYVKNESLIKRDIQETVLEILSKNQLNNMALKQMEPLIKINEENVEIEILPIILEGEYRDLLGTLHHIETNHPELHISSANFYIKENRQLKKEELHLKIYVQKLA
ncbi:MAG: hypothetical protein KDC83_06680 [Flavobacteriales bacterium]|nr:hypothetical protein [Flavobacteriales bacterium]